LGNDIGAHAVQKTDRLLRHIFPWAVDAGFIIVDPTANMKPRKASSPVRKDDYFTVQQVERLLDVSTLEKLAKPNYAKGGYWVEDAPYYRVHLHGLVELGVRIGELAGIRRPDVFLSDDECGSSIRIRRTRLQDYKDRTKEPKTAAGDRIIFISDEFAAMLRHYLEHQYDRCEDGEAARLNPNGYVFTSPAGAPFNIRAFRKQFKKMCRAAGITNLGTDDKPIVPHPHTTRHTFFTHMKESHVPQETFMSIGGHGDPRATARYMGTTDDARKEAIAQYRQRLRRTPKSRS
jgi:integrase